MSSPLPDSFQTYQPPLEKKLPHACQQSYLLPVGLEVSAVALTQNRAQPQNQKNGDDSKDNNIDEWQISPLYSDFHQNFTHIIVTKFDDD